MSRKVDTLTDSVVSPQKVFAVHLASLQESLTGHCARWPLVSHLLWLHAQRPRRPGPARRTPARSGRHKRCPRRDEPGWPVGENWFSFGEPLQKWSALRSAVQGRIGVPAKTCLTSSGQPRMGRGQKDDAPWPFVEPGRTVGTQRQRKGYTSFRTAGNKYVTCTHVTYCLCRVCVVFMIANFRRKDYILRIARNEVTDLFSFKWFKTYDITKNIQIKKN